MKRMLLTSFAVLAFLTVPAVGSLLIPNGNPTGGPIATDGIITSTLDPTPAKYMDDCPWLALGLSAQGIDADGLDDIAGNADDWTITYPDLAGTFTLNAYYPWVNQAPAITVAGHAYPADPAPGSGGATLALTYQPVGKDPNGADVHWVQVIKTNSPLGPQAKHDAGGGYSIYIDNGTNPAGNPYYDHSSAAGNDWFLDTPCRPPTADWEAQVFIASGDLANRTLALYDGIWWGFEVTKIPEPATLLLLGLGGLLLRKHHI